MEVVSQVILSYAGQCENSTFERIKTKEKKMKKYPLKILLKIGLCFRLWKIDI